VLELWLWAGWGSIHTDCGTERGECAVRVLTLTETEEAALAGLLQWEAPDDGPLLDLLEQLCPTYTDPEEDGL
jgi:hypothetical protein